MTTAELRETGFTTKEAATRAGLGLHLLDSWARGSRPILQPSVPSRGQGTRRQYSFQDLVALRLASELRSIGVRTSVIRVAVAAVQNEVRGIDTPSNAASLGEAWVVVDPKNETAIVMDDATELKRASEMADPIAIVLDVAEAARKLAPRRSRPLRQPPKRTAHAS